MSTMPRKPQTTTESSHRLGSFQQGWAGNELQPLLRPRRTFRGPCLRHIRASRRRSHCRPRIRRGQRQRPTHLALPLAGHHPPSSQPLRHGRHAWPAPLGANHRARRQVPLQLSASHGRGGCAEGHRSICPRWWQCSFAEPYAAATRPQARGPPGARPWPEPG